MDRAVEEGRCVFGREDGVGQTLGELVRLLADNDFAGADGSSVEEAVTAWLSGPGKEWCPTFRPEEGLDFVPYSLPLARQAILGSLGAETIRIF
ncbi:hypothetical protein COY93_00315 [Candidatus Uhrbacteria bacterium CG_4_10_14_0_8_um_filter_58_22]|uniref:Uncharacterized protein n=1 Tax=Candidatus Uhrbacteria bacterium CG_4_10_14_0_8_um_filter_58_22 TaxID=1975029 RepID=A0A2M7QB26_9BACT|nr:MAG: hypothetical protein AUJ19_03440 [Parcubacteria group bacterium CG1_02_58_44]PIY63362.1 MAG: hypothetical protein COY93_00315 [Candidatus Uhrbacteria bacterium CG_4_10_14_0_8_um_filter_58_22]